MSTPRNREEAIFEAVLELETKEDRAKYLLQACGEDKELRSNVESLLKADQRAGTFLERPLAGNAIAAPMDSAPSTKTERKSPTEEPGDHIGRYKLLQKIGEGGCGTVYMAEQEEPVRRRVALKIIKVGMDTRQVIARFEAERQALAMMDHPNIARVLDAGATDAGRPFFVMDLVRGIRITDYCDQNKLTTEQRLELFLHVCHAIQHAHQKGIIHRDIKPSNILVTLHDSVALPVIIDFGVAKATEQRLTEKTLFTAFEQFIGTPAYMSPEQAEMSRLDIDTRSDIYSLGVLLYELLTGKTPFDPKTLMDSGLEAMRRTIREIDPSRPSTRLSEMEQTDLTTVAARRHVEPVKLIHLLRGDLDWIVMKCLEKDRTRRYETANGLALDVERYLRNEPVLARPPSRVYRVQKLIRRNKLVFAATTALALALIGGLAVSTFLFMREREAYRRVVIAERNQSRARAEAEGAHASESEQRRAAEESARRDRQNSYAADIYSAFLALQSGNLGRAFDLLDHQQPQAGEEDLRGFEWRYLWQQAQGNELLSLPHPALVSCAVFSPDQQQLATASYDGLVRIWDLAAKRILQTLTGFERQFGWRYIAYSPDGRWFAGVRGGKLTVWNCRQKDFQLVFEQNAQPGAIAFTPDSSRLVAWGGAGLLVLDTGTWEQVTLATRLRPGSFPSVAIDPASEAVAVSTEGQRAIEIWNISSRSPARFFDIKMDAEMAFVSLAWSANGLLAGATWAGQLLLLDCRTGDLLASKPAHTGSVFGLAFDRTGKTLITAGHDQLIHCWSTPKLDMIGTLQGHRDEIWSLAFSQDGRLLCTAGKDGTAKVWTPEPPPAPLYVTDWYAAEFTADGKSLVTLSESELAPEFWDVANPGVHARKTLPISGATNVTRSVLSHDAKLLGVARADGQVEVWSLESGKQIASRTVSEPGVTAMAFSPNGRTLALGSAPGTVELWSLKAGQITRLEAPQKRRVTALSFSQGGHFLRAVLEGRRGETVWDLKDNTPLTIPDGSERFWIAPDGKTLATLSSNYVVKLWDLPNLRERAALKGHRWTINSVAFSADGALVATASGDALTRLWDAATGRELTRPLRGHLQGVTDVAFSPDGRALATGSTDHSVKLWHVATGRELFTIASSAEPVFSPDGNTLTVRMNQGLRFFHVPPLAEIDEARHAEAATDR
jgi:eukaryotic-like serine/threonine-protein kinase